MGHHLSHKGERKKRHISNAYKNVLLLAVHLPLMHKQKQAVQQRTGLHIKPSGVRTENSQSEWFDNHRGSKVNRATLQLGLGELQTQQTAPSIWRWYVGLIAFIFTLLTDLFTLKPGSPHTLDTILILSSITDTLKPFAYIYEPQFVQPVSLTPDGSWNWNKLQVYLLTVWVCNILKGMLLWKHCWANRSVFSRVTHR